MTRRRDAPSTRRRPHLEAPRSGVREGSMGRCGRVHALGEIPDRLPSGMDGEVSAPHPSRRRGEKHIPAELFGHLAGNIEHDRYGGRVPVAQLRISVEVLPRVL